jgi:hypothetical protein
MIMGTLCVVQGTQSALAPTLTFPHGGEKPSECNAKLVHRIGLLVLNVGISIYGLIFKGYDLKVSAAINSLLWIADCLSSLLNNESETLGPTKAGDISFLTFNAAVAYSALNNLPWFGTAFKANALLTFVSSLSCMISPSFGIKFWGVKGDDDSTAYMSLIGDHLFTRGVLMNSLAWGIDPLTAVGYGSATASILHVRNGFFNSDVEKLGIDKRAYSFWAVSCAVVATSILV